MDDYEEEIAEALLDGNKLGKKICGKQGANKCRKRKGNWEGNLHHGCKYLDLHQKEMSYEIVL